MHLQERSLCRLTPVLTGRPASRASGPQQHLMSAVTSSRSDPCDCDARIPRIPVCSIRPVVLALYQGGQGRELWTFDGTGTGSYATSSRPRSQCGSLPGRCSPRLRQCNTHFEEYAVVGCSGLGPVFGVLCMHQACPRSLEHRHSGCTLCCPPVIISTLDSRPDWV